MSRPCGSLRSWWYCLAHGDNIACYAGYPCGSTSFLTFVTTSVLTVKDNFVRYLVQSEEIFQTIQNEHNSVKDPKEKGKKTM